MHLPESSQSGSILQEENLFWIVALRLPQPNARPDRLNVAFFMFLFFTSLKRNPSVLLLSLSYTELEQ